MIKLGIVGYGNLAKACERVAFLDKDIDLVGIFSRRSGLKSPYGTRFFMQDEVFACDCDTLVLCVGSKGDLIPLSCKLAQKFNIVDSFDNHAKMCDYVEKLQKITLANGTLSFVGIGWDPGIFSLVRALLSGVMPCASVQTFWGKGVSQGHSEAIRRIDGVVDAKQYTVPNESAILLAREGGGNSLDNCDKHTRICYVVAQKDANTDEIRQKIITMPHYFAPYRTTVHFVDEDYFYKNCQGMEHAGRIIATNNAFDAQNNAEFSLSLQSNPVFTASILIAYAKANALMSKNGECGVRTILDIPISKILGGDFLDKVRAFI